MSENTSSAAFPHVAIMGATGVGKSSFINWVIGEELAPVGHYLTSETDKIGLYKFDVNGVKGLLLDTPGFDGERHGDDQILRQLADYLETTYRKDFKLTALFYLINIEEVRIKASSARNLELFKKVCGENAMQNVVFIMTHWDEVNKKKAEEREVQYCEKGPLGPLLKLGARTERHDNTQQSAWRIIQSVLTAQSTTTKIQVELVDENKHLVDTAAGQFVDHNIRELIENLRQSREQASQQSSKIKELETSLNRMREERNERSQREKGKQEKERFEKKGPNQGPDWAEVGVKIAKDALEILAKLAVSKAASKLFSSPPSLGGDNVASSEMLRPKAEAKVEPAPAVVPPGEAKQRGWQGLVVDIGDMWRQGFEELHSGRTSI